MTRLLILLLSGAGIVLPAVTTEPANCSRRPCTYRLKCQTAICSAEESRELQDVFQQAYLGDIIELAAGQTWVGNYEINRAPGGDGWLTVRTSAQDMLPPPGVRVTPSHSPNLAKIRTPNFVVALYFFDGPKAARNVRFTGIEIHPADTVNETNADLVRVGNITANTIEELPDGVEFDRCWLHGALAGETRNAIAANGRNIIVRDSYISEIKTSFVENHAFVVYNSPGPFVLYNNYIEASAIPILFGGAEPSIRTPMIPSNLDMRFNYITKPLKWYRRSPYFGGKQYANKTMLEFKVGADSIIRWNVFENNFREERSDQAGVAVAFNIRLPHDKASAWARTDNIQFLDNIVRRSLSAWGILGGDSNYNYTGITQRITIRNNLFQDIGRRWDFQDGQNYYPTFGRLVGGGRDVVIENNTFHSSERLEGDRGPGSALLFDGSDSPKTFNFTYRNNIVPGGSYPFKGDSLGIGASTINAKTRGKVTLTRNVISGMAPAAFQGCRSESGDTRQCLPNWFITNTEWDRNAVGWADADNGDFQVTAPQYKATAEEPAVGVNPEELPKMNGFSVDATYYGAVLQWKPTRPIADVPCVLEVSPDQGLLDKRTAWRSVMDMDPSIIRGADLSSRQGNVENRDDRVFVVGFDGVQDIGGGARVDRRLAPETAYYYRLMCAGDIREGSFRTLPRPADTAVRDISFEVIPPSDLAVDTIVVQRGEKESGAPFDFLYYTDPPIPCSSGCRVILPNVSFRPQYTRVLYYSGAGELVGGSTIRVFP
jgi:hypothetical protein